MKPKKFNIRIYGIFLDEGNVLVTDEFRMGMLMTKFPGGGLKFGEGTIDCLKRECLEELGQEIEVVEHFYTTDYYQPTYLLPEVQQLISIYYLISINKPFIFTITPKKFDFVDPEEGDQTFRWLALSMMDEMDFTLPVDRKVVNLLRKKLLPDNFE